MARTDLGVSLGTYSLLKMIGETTHVNTATKINASCIVPSIIPTSAATVDAATTKLRVEASKTPELNVSRQLNHLRMISEVIIFDMKIQPINKGIKSNKLGSDRRDQRSKLTPTITKKIGIKNPYPNESNWCINSLFGPSIDTTTPAKKAPKIISTCMTSDKATNRNSNANTARVPICTVPLRSTSNALTVAKKRNTT